MDLAKDKAVMDQPVLSSPKQLQRQVCQLLFILNNSSVATRLNSLASQNSPFTWCPSAERAFSELTCHFTAALILLTLHTQLLKCCPVTTKVCSWSHSLFKPIAKLWS